MYVGRGEKGRGRREGLGCRPEGSQLASSAVQFSHMAVANPFPVPAPIPVDQVKLSQAGRGTSSSSSSPCVLIFRLPCRDFPAIAVPSCKLPLPIADTVDELHYDRDDED